MIKKISFDAVFDNILTKYRHFLDILYLIKYLNCLLRVEYLLLVAHLKCTNNAILYLYLYCIINT